MSDLALCCEYLTLDKTCSAVLDSQKARDKRQINCLNEKKMTCCYLCSLKKEFVVGCQYLGSAESKSEPNETQKTETNERAAVETKSEEEHETETKVVCCPTCYAEMSQKKTKLKIDNMGTEHFLPVTVYICSNCGKIELKADK
jgi:hypothetical protein